MHHRHKGAIARATSNVGTGSERNPCSLSKRDMFVSSGQGGQTVDGGGEKRGRSGVVKRTVVVDVVTETAG